MSLGPSENFEILRILTGRFDMLRYTYVRFDMLKYYTTYV